MRALLAAAALLLASCASAPLHPPGSAALVGCAGELDWIQLDSGLRSRTFETTPRPDVVRVAPVGGLVAILDGAAATIAIFDAVDRVERRRIALPSGSLPADLEFTDPRSRLAVAGAGGTTLYVVGARTGELLATADLGATPVALASDPGGDRVVVALAAPNAVAWLDPETGAVLRRMALPSTPTDVALHPERDEVWATSASADTLMVADPGANEVRVAACPGGPSELRMNYDGRHALVLCAGAGDVAAVDTATRALLWRATPPAGPGGAPSRPSGIELEPPGVHLLVVCEDANALHEVDVETGVWVRSIQTAPAPRAVGWLRFRASRARIADDGYW